MILVDQLNSKVRRRGLLRGIAAGSALGAARFVVPDQAAPRAGLAATRRQPAGRPAITHRHIETNGISMHIAEAGTGPLVMLVHGWPELWYSWRHQLPALAAAGYHAVAPD